mmetsp:Transcript_36708/g.104939  ORF Transcript_36708/g.104939 Transcript_36708/m.104939 type:complete len:209 (-) Transcript_36708:44-670(-)
MRRRSNPLKRLTLRSSPSAKLRSQYRRRTNRWNSAVSRSSILLPCSSLARLAMYAGCCCRTHRSSSYLSSFSTTSVSVLMWWLSIFGWFIDMLSFNALRVRMYSVSNSRSFCRMWNSVCKVDLASLPGMSYFANWPCCGLAQRPSIVAKCPLYNFTSFACSSCSSFSFWFGSSCSSLRWTSVHPRLSGREGSSAWSFSRRARSSASPS